MTYINNLKQQVMKLWEFLYHIGTKLFQWYDKHALLINCLGFVFFRLTLDLSYAFVIAPAYAYAGFLYEPSLIRYVLSWAVTFVMVLPLLLVLRQQSPSSIIVTLISLIYFIPLQVLYALGGLGFSVYLLSVIYWVILLACQIAAPNIQLNLSSYKFHQWLFVLGTIGCVLLTFLFSWKYTGFQVILDLNTVYEYRGIDYNMGTLFNYIWGMIGVALPFLGLYYLSRKRYISTCLIFVSAFLHFSVYGHKTTFFLIILALASYIFYRKERGAFFSYALGGATILGIIAYKLFNIVHIASYVNRRLMWIPGQVSSQYVEYFTTHPTDLWRGGLLRWLGFRSPYQGMPIANMIGWLYYNAETAANNGLIGDAVQAFGYLGVFILPIVLVFCFRLLDLCGGRLPSRITVVACIYFANAFCNSSWSTVLVSHGYLPVCLLFLLWPTQEVHDITTKEIKHYANQ